MADAKICDNPKCKKLIEDDSAKPIVLTVGTGTVVNWDDACPECQERAIEIGNNGFKRKQGRRKKKDDKPGSPAPDAVAKDAPEPPKK